MPIWTWVPPASRGHMLLIVLRIVVWPALVVASVSAIIGTGQPWFGPYNVSQSVTIAPWVSVAVLWALTPLVAQVLARVVRPPQRVPVWPTARLAVIGVGDRGVEDPGAAAVFRGAGRFDDTAAPVLRRRRPRRARRVIRRIIGERRECNQRGVATRAVALEKLLGVVAFWEIVSEPVPAVNCAAVPVTAVIVVFAGMPLPTMICPTVGTVEK